jgi:hypothetical protein
VAAEPVTDLVQEREGAGSAICNGQGHSEQPNHTGPDDDATIDAGPVHQRTCAAANAIAGNHSIGGRKAAIEDLSSAS